ncbi:MAG: AAA family ATPase [Chloroflexi bacterium]|nr:AAA family ATPase [Chloroflexota bacterium]
MSDWWIFRGEGQQHNRIKKLPDPPGWRKPKHRGPVITLIPDPKTGFPVSADGDRGSKYEASEDEKEMVNAALFLRRPLLITGKPGSGKSSLAYAIAWELGLGTVLRWSITTRATLQEGLYRYDAIARLQDTALEEKRVKLSQAIGQKLRPAKATLDSDIGQYLQLGPLGTALLPYDRPRVLLIDEIDKSDLDLPNDLLNVFEEGEFEIPELVRRSKTTETVQVIPFDGLMERDRVEIRSGQVQAMAFPLMILTSNGEREFPQAFLRRCLRLEIPTPSKEKLERIVQLHFKDQPQELEVASQLISQFIERSKKGELATDQLLNAIYLLARSEGTPDRQKLTNNILRFLDSNQ